MTALPTERANKSDKRRQPNCSKTAAEEITKSTQVWSHGVRNQQAWSLGVLCLPRCHDWPCIKYEIKQVFAPYRHLTMVENRKKNTDKIAIQSLTVPQTREWVKWASKRTSERCERMSERTSEWPSTSVCILSYSGPVKRGEIEYKPRRFWGGLVM